MKYCCEDFPQIMKTFSWFSYANDDGKQILLMPCLLTLLGEKRRVNHCPVCGADVRGIMIPEDEYFKIIP